MLRLARKTGAGYPAPRKGQKMAERIGDFLVRTGAMQQAQVESVLAAQKGGDKRTFGEIAVALGFTTKAVVDSFTAH